MRTTMVAEALRRGNHQRRRYQHPHPRRSRIHAVTKATGFIVVRRHSRSVTPTGDPRFRGLARMVPWLQEAYEKGFDDPYVFGDFADDRGLIRTREAAQHVLSRF